jgi:dihydrofolate synthase/folylpolyglutamate synthase
LQAALTNLHASVSVHESIAAALEAQCERATPDDEILVFGSFYSVAEALSWLENQAAGE